MSSSGKKYGLQSLLRDKVYRMRKARFVEALSSNSVGQALLTDPHIKHARLSFSPDAPAVYDGNRQNQFEGSINMLPASQFPSLAEHHASYTHEALHKAHQTWAPNAYEHRRNTPGTHPGWSNAEEEFTITGRDRAFPTFAPSTLHENRARQELGLAARNAHAKPSEDLPRDMSAEEYRAHRAVDGGAAIGFIPIGDSNRPLRKKPVLSSSRKKKE